MATPTLAPRIRFKTPAICHKSFQAPPDIPPGALPPSLNGWAAWTDPDPLNPAQFTSVITINQVGPGPIYVGIGPGEIDFFRVFFWRNPATRAWQMHLILNGQRVPEERYIFQSFTIDETLAFDTGLRTEHPAQPAELRQFRFTY